jgi:hypothetical protein
MHILDLDWFELGYKRLLAQLDLLVPELIVADIDVLVAQVQFVFYVTF